MFCLYEEPQGHNGQIKNSYSLIWLQIKNQQTHLNFSLKGLRRCRRGRGTRRRHLMKLLLLMKRQSTVIQQLQMPDQIFRSVRTTAIFVSEHFVLGAENFAAQRTRGRRRDVHVRDVRPKLPERFVAEVAHAAVARRRARVRHDVGRLTGV